MIGGGTLADDAGIAATNQRAVLALCASTRKLPPTCCTGTTTVIAEVMMGEP
jgi:hypothetical protein